MLSQAMAALIPQRGAMCLLADIRSWDAGGIVCVATSHLDPGNPLRRGGRLGAVCGIEYAMQAAALHGGLLDGAPQPAGWVASVRGVTLAAERLDDPAHGPLQVAARLERREAGGLLYAFEVSGAAGILVDGRAAIALPQP